MLLDELHNLPVDAVSGVFDLAATLSFLCGLSLAGLAYRGLSGSLKGFLQKTKVNFKFNQIDFPPKTTEFILTFGLASGFVAKRGHPFFSAGGATRLFFQFSSLMSVMRGQFSRTRFTLDSSHLGFSLV